MSLIRRYFNVACLCFSLFANQANAGVCRNLLIAVKYTYLSLGRLPLQKVFLEMNRIKELPRGSARLAYRTLKPTDVPTADKLLTSVQDTFYPPTANRTLIDVSHTETLNVLQSSSNKLVENELLQNSFALYDIKSNTFAGLIGGAFNLSNNTFEISYAISEAFRGKGYATEALIAFTRELAQKAPGNYHIIARAYSDNEASKAVLIKAGFTRIGTSVVSDKQIDLFELKQN